MPVEIWDEVITKTTITKSLRIRYFRDPKSYLTSDGRISLRYINGKFDDYIFPADFDMYDRRNWPLLGKIAEWMDEYEQGLETKTL